MDESNVIPILLMLSLSPILLEVPDMIREIYSCFKGDQKPCEHKYLSDHVSSAEPSSEKPFSIVVDQDDSVSIKERAA